MVFFRLVILLFLCTTVLSLPIPSRRQQRQQVPISADNAAGFCKPSEDVETYTTEWFLKCTLPEHREEIHGKALFYTKGASKTAQKLACAKKSEYVTLWQICMFPSFCDTDKQR